jgi:hypothetical protein
VKNPNAKFQTADAGLEWSRVGVVDGAIGSWMDGSWIDGLMENWWRPVTISY